MNFIKIILLFFIYASAASPQQQINGDDCKADLQVKTDSPDSWIFINQKPAGSGNIRIDLPGGMYIVTVKENINGWDAKRFIDTLLIKDCGDYKLNYSFTPDVYLETEPEDVKVFTGDVLYGHTPLFIRPGLLNGVIELKKEGYEDKIIRLGDLGRNNLIKLNYTGKAAEKSFFEEDVFKILVGSLAVLGATTAYFKLKADDEFENYQFSGSSRALENTRRYDLISGISFAALQVNFGVLIYFFLFD